MPAILFGSISTLADTSELQRAAFNEAFAAAGLDWSWDQDEYRDLLTGNGGEQRIADYAAKKGDQVDAAAVHAEKSAAFQRKLAENDLQARPGVAETIAAAKSAGWQVGLVTTTSASNITALLDGLGSQAPRDVFDVIVDREDVAEGKPDPEVYRFALDAIGAADSDCVAVEDNVGGVASAEAAGVRCVAFPNENTAGHDFGTTQQVDRLDFAKLDASGAA